MVTPENQAEKTLKQFLPDDVTPEEIEMMVFIQQLLRMGNA